MQVVVDAIRHADDDIVLFAREEESRGFELRKQLRQNNSIESGT